MHHLTKFLPFVLAVSLLHVSCENEPEPEPEPDLGQCGTLSSEITDPRDGQTYQILEIGTQCWFAENLNYASDNSWCYEDKEGNCNIYGRLYTWEAAVNACPTGWHLPTNDEWGFLAESLGGAEIAGGQMKSVDSNRWEAPNTGATNESGFTGLPGGYRGSGGSYHNMGRNTYFWTNTSNSTNANYGINRGLSFTLPILSEPSTDKRFGLAVRCVRD
ncbi:MAG: fibrobacter succinogenes major paralogous domain-containing protein [Bacteroidia bacterium]|nr:fibrobacter succinogenes major paralogous domain-containing protein [Bacteroidia bacterium]